MDANVDFEKSSTTELDAGEFYFETDFYLLKKNKDYQNLLKTLAILEVQRSIIVQNIEKIVELEEKVIKNPLSILNKIVKQEDFGVLKKVTVAKVPKIDWSKYTTHEESEQSKLVCDINLRNKNISDKQELQSANATDVDKPETFKKPWSVEEQLRLEELLVEYPPERNESNRHRKIAEALGTRNLRQVCSRIQKYNMKMKKVGQIKPINASAKNLNKKTATLSHRNIGALLKPTTFIPSTTLSDDVDVYNSDRNNVKLKQNIEMSSERKLEILDQVLKDKLSESDNCVIHKNYKCCMCQLDPILGTRWNCSDCPSIGRSTDFCSDCIVDLVRNIFEEPPHPLDHCVIPIKHIQEDDNLDSLVDPNYVPLVFKTQNYLDPNFMVQS
ncbi:ZZ-type zinc finger-containing protein 3 [Adelges cooleyi]|uniref:ZZ-type zinc finger-containing protein 3 n=1 Tax=Adelges cooleyi TaxID=133065 RepID=UPI0021809948|nr:ZZ-type zinc finger-containing protein 3 [Adelges cooleyi]